MNAVEKKKKIDGVREREGGVAMSYQGGGRRGNTAVKVF